MSELKEYVVTLYRHEDLDSFYLDMETEGGNLYIPNRRVEVANRRPISRNTHYWLTDNEADQLKQDKRVLAVSRPLHTFTDLVVNSSYTQTAKFDPGYSFDSDSKNWGLLFSTSDTINSTLQSNNPVTTSISRKLTGKNVDVVGPESVIKKNHAEFAVNNDGTGGYRTVEADWYSFGLGSPPGIIPQPNYIYDYSYIPVHNTHVIGTVAGNTQGWARDSKIYFDVPAYSSTPYQGSWDYIRAWHNWKKTNQINSNLGRHNPTVVALSTNIRTARNISDITSITYRGTTYTGPWTSASPSLDATAWTNGTVTLAALGFRNEQIRYLDSTYKVFLGPGTSTYAAENADIEDAITDGIIIVQSAGNYGMKIDVPGGPDYNNSVTVAGETFYQNRNEWTAGVIAAGNLSPSLYSGGNGDTGPGITLWAPGSYILSSVPDGYGGALDPRNLNNDRIQSYSGTSMACPQIAGVIACLLELKPSFNQSDVKNYLLNVAKSFKIDEGNGETTKTLYFPDNTFSITADTTTLTPGQKVNFTITFTNVPVGSTLYLKEVGSAQSNAFDDGVTQTSFVTSTSPVVIDRILQLGFSGTTSQLQLLTGGYNGTVQATSELITLSSVQKVCIFGDSVSTYGGVQLTVGQPPNVDASYSASQDWSITYAIQKLYPNYTVVNVSRGGMTTSEALSGATPIGLTNPFGASGTITQYITDNNPNKIVLRYGAADAVLIKNATTTLNNIQTIIDFAVGLGIEVILVGVNHNALPTDPVNPGYFGPTYTDSAMINAGIAINNGIISKATAQGLKYANPRVLTAPPKSLPDGIHPYRNFGGFITREILAQLRTQVPLIEQGTPPSETYVFTSPGTGTSIYEGGIATFTLTTTGVPNGTVLWWNVATDTGAQPVDVFSPLQGFVTINSNAGTISVNIAADAIDPETDESFYIDLYLTQADRDSFINPITYSNVVGINNGPVPTSSLKRYGSPVINYLLPPTALGQATAAEVSRAGYQLLRATQKTHPWREAGLSESQTISRDISYKNDGRYVDLIIADNGTWAGHTEFINRNVTNAKNPTNYIGGNVLPGNGYCDLLDIVLDAPYYIDPDWFNADSTNRLMTRWDGTRVPVEQVARNWWRASTNRSAKFASMGNVYVSDFYTRLSTYGSNTERPTLNGTHGTQCASQAYGRTLGWAFNANKWVLNNIGNNSCGYENGFTLQKLFHQFKPVNPVFGTKDPTLSSNSWGFRAVPNSAGFGIYRGTAYQYTDDNTKPHFMRYVGDAGDAGRMKGEMIANSITVAAKEMIDAGVITLVAAGNSSQQLVKSDHPNYNNYWTTDPTIPLVQTIHSAFGYFYYNTTNRRGFPQQAGKYTSNGQTVYPVIQVGALDDQYVTGLEAKVNYSDMGNDIDCYAPGDGTWAASASSAGNVRYDFSYPDAQLVSFDTRFSGTSSACPTAAGIIATKLATNRTWTWQDVKSWLSNNVGVLASGVFYNPPETTAGDGIGYADLNNPQGSDLRVIWDAPLTTSNPLDTVLVSASLTFTVGQTAVNKRPVVAQDGSGTITYAISPALPSGLTFNTSSGFILGTALASLAATSFTVTATDSVGSSSKTFTLSIVDFSITVTGNKTFTEDETITPFTLASITGGVSPFAYYLPSTIPQYLFWNGGTNVMSGVAKEIGTKTLDLRVVDANGVEKTGSFTITINAAGPAPIYDFDATISNSTFTAGANRTSNEETVTVENTGNTPITINNISVSNSGGVTPTFDYTNWGTPTPNTISPGLTKSFTIKFTGATAGSFNNTISFSGSNGTSDVINITNNILAQTYDITPNKLSVNEGGSVTFNIVTTNYGNGTLYWKNIGTTKTEDFSSPFRDTGIGSVLTGDVTITSNIGSFTLTLSNDQTTEGAETIIIELYADQALTQLVDTSDAVTVVDTSTAEIPSYTISANTEFLDEGDTVLFYIKSNVIQEGETFYWTNEGTTSASDFTDNLNSGQVYINSYVNLLYRTVSNDYKSESRETIKIALRFGSVTGPILANSIPVYVRDTSATPTATYNLTSDKITVNEGDTVNFEVTTTNIMDRTVLYWTTRGNVDLEDFKDNKLQGSFKIVNNQGAFRRTLKNDIKTELPETFTIELRKRSIYGPIVDEVSVSIVDTSVTPPVDPEPTPEVIPGGGTKLGKLNARVPIIIRLP